MSRMYWRIIIIMVLIVAILGCRIIFNTHELNTTQTIVTPIYAVSKETDIVEVENEYVFHPYYELSDDERHVVESIVMGEAEGESYTGKLLVAQCILNASLKEGLPPSQIRVEYKYSGWNENPDDDVKNAVSEIFDYGYKVVDEEILYFYAPKYVDSTWHESLKHVITEGGHKFFTLWEE